MDEGGLLDQSMELAGYSSREEALDGRRLAERPIGRLGGARRDRRRDRLPVLGARLLHLRRGLERRWRNRPGHHLICASCCSRRRTPSSSTPTAAPRRRCSSRCTAGPSNPGLVFTERRSDLKRHAGRDLLPRRAPRRGRGAARHRPARGRGGDRSLARASRGRRRTAPDRHVRHQLQGPPLRRADRGGNALRAQPDRGGERPGRLAWTTWRPPTRSGAWSAAASRSRPTPT